MQANIHPEYREITVSCSCGHKFVTSSTLGKDLNIEVCNECHPFYTGKQKIVDTAGRVERFKGKFAGFSVSRNKDKEEASSQASAKEVKTESTPKTTTSKAANPAPATKASGSSKTPGKASAGKTAGSGDSAKKKK